MPARKISDAVNGARIRGCALAQMDTVAMLRLTW
jgi:hypothetical protein